MVRILDAFLSAKVCEDGGPKEEEEEEPGRSGPVGQRRVGVPFRLQSV